jgi:predicted enzyme related to lactoylglutathione lyase
VKIEKVGMVIHPVEDLEAAARFYRDGLGLEPKFRDGDRFCAFDAGGVTIALATGDEAIAQQVVVSYKVADADAALAELEAAGAVILQPLHDGPHERRAVLEDPAGNSFVVYAPR